MSLSNLFYDNNFNLKCGQIYNSNGIIYNGMNPSAAKFVLNSNEFNANPGSPVVFGVNNNLSYFVVGNDIYNLDTATANITISKGGYYNVTFSIDIETNTATAGQSLNVAMLIYVNNVLASADNNSKVLVGGTGVVNSCHLSENLLIADNAVIKAEVNISGTGSINSVILGGGISGTQNYSVLEITRISN